ISRVSDMLPAGGSFIWIPNHPAHWERPRVNDIHMHDNFRREDLSASAVNAKQSALPGAALFRTPAAAHQQYLSQTFPTALSRDARTEMIAQAIQSPALVSLAPATTVSARALSGFSIKSP